MIEIKTCEGLVDFSKHFIQTVRSFVLSDNQLCVLDVWDILEIMGRFKYNVFPCMSLIHPLDSL